MSKESVKLTIGMPVYNGGKHLTTALDSLLNQTYKNFILIISDNASTDDTEKICKSYQKKDSRIKYYRNKQNIGATNNFQRVLKIANTPYFMWAAHDDLWEPEFVSELIKLLEDNNNINLAFCDFDFIKGDNNEERFKVYDPSYFYFDQKEDLYMRLKVSIHQNLAMFIYGINRTNVLKESRGFSYSEGDYAWDNLFLTKLAFNSRFIFHPKILYHKRERTYTHKASLGTKIKSTILTFRDFLTNQTKFRIRQRKIIINSELNLLNKIKLIYNTYIAQIFNNLVIFLVTLTSQNQKNQSKLIKILSKIFLKYKLI